MPRTEPSWMTTVEQQVALQGAATLLGPAIKAGEVLKSRQDVMDIS
ncbi:hypothetical protein [Paracoccus shandongensis]|nr:hypothetical protein [Paracoccus shandongensis]